eukprot:scaffold1448_cov387-Prasinococcus_capsulatus_cf.AAC.2
MPDFTSPRLLRRGPGDPGKCLKVDRCLQDTVVLFPNYFDHGQITLNALLYHNYSMLWITSITVFLTTVYDRGLLSLDTTVRAQKTSQAICPCRAICTSAYASGW